MSFACLLAQGVTAPSVAPQSVAAQGFTVPSFTVQGVTAGLSSGDLSRRRAGLRTQRAFTLVEMLVAMVITLVMLGIVVTIFGLVGDSVSASRAGMEMSDQLRAAKHRLQLDLAGVTTQMLPPRRPEYGEGYFEIIEGPVGRLPANTKWVPDESNPPVPGVDTTVGDNDDILMLTTRSKGDPFVGRYCDVSTTPATIRSIQSQVAEVAWFIRGTTLYRRQLLVRPELPVPQPTNPTASPYYRANATYPQDTNFYNLCDLSVRSAGGAYDLSPTPPGYYIAANSLEDLTKRENRFGHAPLVSGTTPFGWPHDVRGFGTFYSAKPYGMSGLGIPTVGRLGLPTLRECSHLNFPLPGSYLLSQALTVTDTVSTTKGNSSSNLPVDPNSINQYEFDAWDNPNPWNNVDPTTGTMLSYYTPSATTQRVSDDIILTNVLSFDIRVWDPTAWIISQSDKSNINTYTYAPGDPGYTAAVYDYVMNGTNTYNYGLLSQGAYVDLGYYSSFATYAKAVKGTDLSSLSGSPLLRLATATPSTLSVPAIFPFQGTSGQLSSFLLNGWPSPSNSFFGPGEPNSGLDSFLRSSTYVYATDSYGHYAVGPAVYDTGSWHYEEDGIDQDGAMGADQGTNGLDDNSNGLVDEDAELEAPPPYSTPLRGIQIKIRCFEPDSHQIREVTVVQEFVPE